MSPQADGITQLLARCAAPFWRVRGPVWLHIHALPATGLYGQQEQTEGGREVARPQAPRRACLLSALPMIGALASTERVVVVVVVVVVVAVVVVVVVIVIEAVVLVLVIVVVVIVVVVVVVAVVVVAVVVVVILIVVLLVVVVVVTSNST